MPDIAGGYLCWFLGEGGGPGAVEADEQVGRTGFSRVLTGTRDPPLSLVHLTRKAGTDRLYKTHRGPLSPLLPV
jgi:hypothetical protein